MSDVDEDEEEGGNGDGHGNNEGEGDGDGAEREPRDGGERDEDGGRVRAAVQAGADDARDER